MRQNWGECTPRTIHEWEAMARCAYQKEWVFLKGCQNKKTERKMRNKWHKIHNPIPFMHLDK